MVSSKILRATPTPHPPRYLEPYQRKTRVERTAPSLDYREGRFMVSKANLLFSSGPREGQSLLLGHKKAVCPRVGKIQLLGLKGMLQDPPFQGCYNCSHLIHPEKSGKRMHRLPVSGLTKRFLKKERTNRLQRLPPLLRREQWCPLVISNLWHCKTRWYPF